MLDYLKNLSIKNSFKRISRFLHPEVAAARNNDYPQKWDCYKSVIGDLNEVAVLNKITDKKRNIVHDYEIADLTLTTFQNLTGMIEQDLVGTLASKLYGLGKAPFLEEIDKVYNEKKNLVFDTYFSSIEKHLNITICYLTDVYFVTIFKDITSKKISEVDANITQSLLDSIVRQSPDIIYRLNKHGDIIFVSEAIKTYGYKPEELIGTPIMDLVYPDDVGKAQFKINERRTGDRSTKTLEIRLQTLKDNPTPFETLVVNFERTPYFTVDAEGQYFGTSPNSDLFVGTMGIMRDITHRKLAMDILEKSNEELDEMVQQRTTELNRALADLEIENNKRRAAEEELRIANSELEKTHDERSIELVESNKKLKKEIEDRKNSEKALQEKEAELHLALDVGNICTWVWDVSQNKVSWPYNAEKFFNLSRSELAGDYGAFLKLIAPQDKKKVKLKIRRVLKESFKNFSIDFRINDKDGNVRWVQVKASRIEENKQNISYRGTVIDLTEQFKADYLLKEAEQKYRTLFEQSPNSILVIDPYTLKPIEFNDNTHNLFGYRREEFKEITIDQLYPNAENIKSLAKKVLKTGEIKFEVPITTKNGAQKDIFITSKATEYLGKKVLHNIIIDVSKYKKYERELKKISNVTRQTTDNVIITDKNGVIEYVNPAFEKFSGYKSAAVIGKTTEFLNSGKTQDLHSIINTGNVFKGEIANKNKDGKLYFEETTVTPLTNNDGETTHFVATAKEITASIETVESLRKFSNIVKQIGDSVIITNKEGVIEYVNDSFEKCTGFTPKEAVGKKPSIMKSGLHDQSFYKKLWDTITSGSIFTDTIINKKKSGEIFHEEMTVSPLKNKDGIITHFISTGKDITNRIEIEKSLKASEDNYKALYDNNPSMVFEIDSEGIILSVNKFGAKSLGYKVEDLVHTHAIELYHSEDRETFDATVKKCVKNPQQVVNAELKLLNKEGDIIWVNETIQAAATGEDNDLIIFIVCNDITENKKNQLEKDELQSQLLQVQKMDAVGTLAGGIAHDFNNMLTVINGHAEVGLLGIDKEQPAHRHMVSILKAGKRAENLTRQLLAFSRRQIYEPQVLNINHVINDMDKMMRRLIGDDIAITTKIKESLPSIKGEKGQIEQILMNLIVNARDAINEHSKSASGKKITIETDEILLDEVYASKHMGSKPGKYVMIAITDNGTGMSADVQNKIFEPFYTTKSVGHGTGLGLATVYGIIKQNEAFIYVYSEPGKGTTFKIFWPIVKTKNIAAEIEQPVNTAIKGDETILLVEDDESVRAFASSALTDLGYKVHESPNGKDALDLVQDKKIMPDLIVTDMVMPEMNGREFIALLEPLFPKLKVLYTSGYTDTYISDQGELIQGINFLQKPFSLNDLAKKIREILKEDN